MGQKMSFGLTQYDVEELSAHCGSKFNQREIEALYKRFRSLDRGHKGYISAEEFFNIPELSINPLARRLERLFESVNFKEFVAFLSAFSSRASTDDKLQFLFTVYDIDGDGYVGANDMELMLRHLAGASLGDTYITQIVRKALEEASSGEPLTLADFKAVLGSCNLQVEVPTD